MTTQEFVKQEAQKHLEKVPNGMVNAPLLERSFANGLTKGLEIAKEFAVWRTRCIYDDYSKTWLYFSKEGRENVSTSELLTIFLTEKYGNNG